MLNYIENIRHTLFESSYRDYQLIPSYLLKPNKVVIIGRRFRPLLRSCFGFGLERGGLDSFVDQCLR